MSPALRTPEGAYAVLHKLLHKAAMRLRAAQLWTTHMTLSIKYAVPKAAGRRASGPGGALEARGRAGGGAGPGSVHSSGIPQATWSQGHPR